jgi:hypothetical protein
MPLRSSRPVSKEKSVVEVPLFMEMLLGEPRFDGTLESTGEKSQFPTMCLAGVVGELA